jgi:hypothetical protein
VEGSEYFYPLLKELRERVLLLKHLPDPRPDWQELVTVNGVVRADDPDSPRGGAVLAHRQHRR